MGIDSASISLLLSIISLVFLILGFADQKYRVQVQSEQRLSAIQSKNDQRFVALETKMDLFWKCIERNAPNILHSDGTPEIDALLDKMNAGTLDLKGQFDLRLLIEQGLRTGVFSEDKKTAATIVLAALEQRILNEGKA